MTAVSGNYYTLAIGKQSAKGTAQTTPAYKLKVIGGDIAPVKDSIQLAETDASRQQGQTVVVGARVEGSPDFYLRPDDFGLLAYGLLGANANSGTNPNYIHTATMLNSGALPYFTIYKAIGGNTIVDRYVDCRITGAKIKGQAGQALSSSFDISGITTLLGSSDPVLNPVTQTPLVYPDVTVVKAGSPPGTVESFEIDIANNPLVIQADGGINPYDIIPGQLAISGTFTLLFESDADYRSFYGGSASATAVNTTVFTQSLSIRCYAGMGSNANLGVTFDFANVAYTSYPVPPDPGGAPIKVAVGWRSMPDAATISNYAQVTTRNAVASY